MVLQGMTKSPAAVVTPPLMNEESRGLNYRLAWSIAVFLEKGAREVRHDPFRTLKADYFEALFNTQDMRKATAIVMGTEATGLTNSWRQAADAHIRIPMLGRIDSLNVSVSAAILLFEAIRQRGGGMKL